MQFTSRFAALQLPVRDEDRQYFPDGRSIVKRPALLADFAEEAFSERYSAEGMGGEYDALAGGGFFDTDVAAKKHSWTEEEKEAVENALLYNAEHDGDCQLHVLTPPTPPWPTYQKMTEQAVIQNAISLGLVQEAIIFEERTEARESILAPLREELAAAAELTVA